MFYYSVFFFFIAGRGNCKCKTTRAINTQAIYTRFGIDKFKTSRELQIRAAGPKLGHLGHIYI